MRFLAAHLRSKGHVVVCAASTGNAAANYEGGITGHSIFRLPLEPEPNSTCQISMGTQRAALLRNARLIIWDEFSNVHKESWAAFLRLIGDLKSPYPQVTF